MATLQWALTCKNAIVAKHSNSVTYRDAIESLSADQFPAQLPPVFVVATLWRRDDPNTPETARARVVAENGEGDQLGVSKIETLDLKGFERFRAHFPNPEFELRRPGRVWFQVQLETQDGWETVQGIPVEFTRPDSAIESPAVAEE